METRSMLKGNHELGIASLRFGTGPQSKVRIKPSLITLLVDSTLLACVMCVSMSVSVCVCDIDTHTQTVTQ